MDFELLPADVLDAEAEREERLQRSYHSYRVAVPAAALEALLSKGPTISEYDGRCWWCDYVPGVAVDFRDPRNHRSYCSWAECRRLVDEYRDDPPPF